MSEMGIWGDEISLYGRHKHQPTMDRSMITGVLQFFSMAVSHLGFRTGYNSSDPGKNGVNSSSSHKLQMKSYNLCLLWIITIAAKIKIFN